MRSTKKMAVVDVAAGETEEQATARSEMGMGDQAPAVALHALTDLIPSPFNSRKDLGDIAGLAASIRQSGLLQPLVARPKDGKLELVFGHRRLAAAAEAGLGVVPVIVQELTDEQVHARRLVENLQREALNRLEEAAEFKQLRDAGLSAEEIADRVGVKRSTVYARLKLLELGPAGRKAYLAGQIDASVAELLARLPAQLQGKATDQVLDWGREDGVSFRQARELIERAYMLDLDRASWSLDDAELVPAAGACSACPKRTGAQPDLFGPRQQRDLCMDTPCFKAKGDAWWKRKEDEAKAGGQKVLPATEAKEVLTKWGVARDADFVEANTGCHQDEKHRTYKQLLGRSAKAHVVLARHPETNEVVELVPKQGLKNALDDAGLIKRASRDADPGPSSDWKKQIEADKRKCDRQEKACSLALAELVSKVEAKEPDAKFWRFLAEKLLLDFGAGAMEERRKLEPNWEKKWLPKLNEAQLRGVVFEMLLAGDCVRRESVKEACDVWKVDLKKFEDQVKEEEKAAEKLKKEAAKAGTKTKKGAAP